MSLFLRLDARLSKLICLSFFPVVLFLVILIINSHKPDGLAIKLIVHAFFQTCFLYALFCLAQRSLILKITLITLIVFAFFMQISYGNKITAGAIISAISTSPGEAYAFIQFNFLAIFTSIFIILSFLFLPLTKQKRATRYLALLGFCYLVAPTIIDSASEGAKIKKQVYINSGTARGYSPWYSTIEYYLVEQTAWRLPLLYSLRATTDTYKIIFSDVSLESTWSDVKTSKNSPNLIVLGIGESLRANNMSLYGYHRQTTPLLDKLTHLKVFKKAISAGTNTYGSVPASLTKFSNTSDLSKSIINLAKDAGYKTYWLSNQAKFSRWDFSVSAIAEQASYTFFPATRESEIGDDSVLIEKLNSILSVTKSNEKKLIVLHFYGSHMTFSDRYPAEFSKYQSSDELLDTYDNSILYTDYIQAEIIKLVEEKQGEYLFFSDHGLGDPNGEMRLSHDLRTPPQLTSLEVPLFIYTKRELELEKYQGFTLFYFECLFSEWTGITALELNQNSYCINAINKTPITYIDSNMAINELKPAEH